MYYALWYYINEDNHIISKSTNAISTDINDLYKLQNNIELDSGCYYQKYRYLIKNIIVQPIKCYIYDNKSQQLKELIENNDFNLIDINLYSIYSSYNSIFVIDSKFDDNFILEEILIYLTKEDHDIWLNLHLNKDKENIVKNDLYPSFFYNESISHHCIQPDVYYEEGIMNA
jgi:hypothetical protein